VVGASVVGAVVSGVSAITTEVDGAALSGRCGWIRAMSTTSTTPVARQAARVRTARRPDERRSTGGPGA
jgi:hypothetical protein